MAIDRICTVEGCNRKAHSKGLCSAHKSRLRRYGDPSGGGDFRDEMAPTCAVEGCGQRREARGLCAHHYANLRRRGDPASEPTKAANGTLLAWLAAHVDHQGEDCLIWPFSSGYGTVKVNGRSEKAHRYMCRLAHGAPPTLAHHAAHNCGKGHEGCVHPQHLRWDTAIGNHADRYEHGTMLLGEACWNAVLTEETVRWARSMVGSLTYKEMGKVLGVHAGTVRHAVLRETWAWLD